jgi:hypothetical protein
MSAAARPRPAPLSSIGAELERQRLEHRARRVDRAIAVMRDLATSRARDDRAPAALWQAIEAFSEELAAIDRRLGELLIVELADRDAASKPTAPQGSRPQPVGHAQPVSISDGATGKAGARRRRQALPPPSSRS